MASKKGYVSKSSSNNYREYKGIKTVDENNKNVRNESPIIVQGRPDSMTKLKKF